MPDTTGRTELIRLLGGMGAFGGLLWAVVPLVAALAFYGVEIGLGGVGGLLRLGALFRFAGLSVIFMLAGVAGVHLRFRGRYGRSGRLGAAVSAVGFILLLPGSVLPSGSGPESLVAIVPLVFFAGLVTIALGSVVLGVATRRSGVLPSRLAVAYAASMPAGATVGGIVAVAYAGNIALVLGLTVPFGFAWIALGGYVVWTSQ